LPRRYLRATWCAATIAILGGAALGSVSAIGT
jgi:hypothetical protein